MANKLCLDAVYKISFVELEIQFHISFTISGNGCQLGQCYKSMPLNLNLSEVIFLSPGLTLSTEGVWFKKMLCMKESTSFN